MGFVTLDVKVISARDLKYVNLITKMDVYAVVSISGDPQKQKFKTPVHHDAGPNPTWNFPIKFAVDDSLAHQNRLSIVFEIKSKRILGDKDIGDVIVPVKELIDGKSPQPLCYQVRTTGKPKGLLYFSYKFGDVVPAAAATAAMFNEPVTAYPVTGSNSAPNAVGTPPPPAAGYPYLPSHETVGYAYPPPLQHPGYGAYPAQGGYGYPPVQQQAPKKNKLRMGLEGGLLGVRLGGLLIGDIGSETEMDMGGSDF